ncbi:MAG: hypothetical protein RQ899_01275 [Pseudomonadales bacterium]|nr:hypothetical protein [Pseudomonadales bacterium]
MSDNTANNSSANEADSRADALAALALVLITVSAIVFFVSHQ